MEHAKMTLSVDPLKRARQTVYEAFVRTGKAPPSGEVTADDLRALAAARVVVLYPDGETIRFAAPFANGETAFRVTSGGRTWFAPCAWDAFAIPAALHGDAAIEARCAQTGLALDCGVREGRPYGKAVVHMLVPAARFWENIVYT